MGKSQTVHIIGQYKTNKPGWHGMVTATTMLEMVQERIKAKRAGHPIVDWYAQTYKGADMLKRLLRKDLINKGKRFWNVVTYEVIPDNHLDFSRIERQLIPCPRCGHFDFVSQGCQVCNMSGVTTKRQIKPYRNGQLKPLEAPTWVNLARELPKYNPPTHCLMDAVWGPKYQEMQG